MPSISPMPSQGCQGLRGARSCWQGGRTAGGQPQEGINAVRLSLQESWARAKFQSSSRILRKNRHGEKKKKINIIFISGSNSG